MSCVSNDLELVKVERLFYIPKCEHPVVIVNENALRLISQGARSPIPIVNSYNHAVVSKASIIKAVVGDQKIDYNKLSSYEVHLEDEEEYLFQLVGCGSCIFCQDKKQLDLVNRCRLESELYDCPAYFFTLTYDNEHLPYRGELKYTDVQRFWKRLRMRWTRSGIDHNIRFLVAGEYGSLRGRPHYHVILWNNPYKCSEFTPLTHKQLARDIFESWNMCQWSGFDFGQCGDGAAAYAAKYAGKPKTDCKHWTKPFIKGSIKNGGIGYPYIAKYLDYYRNNPNLDKIIYVSKFDGMVHEINYGSYVSQHIFPSPSRQVPAEKKSQFKQLTDLLQQLIYLDYCTFESAYDTLNALRPASCIRIKLQRNVGLKTSCHLKRAYYINQYLKVCDKLFDDLSVLDPVDAGLPSRPDPIEQPKMVPALYFKMRQNAAKAREIF